MDIKLSCNSCGQHLVVDASAGGTTINCPSCGTQLTIPEVIIEARSPEIKHSILWGLFWVLVVFVVLGMLAHFLSLPNEETTQHGGVAQHKSATQDEAADAYFAAKLFCEKCAPTATNFRCDPELPAYDHKAKWSSNSNPPHWCAMGYVDCQRPYGASKSNLRQLWVVELVHNGDKWHITWLDIAGEKLYQGD